MNPTTVFQMGIVLISFYSESPGSFTLVKAEKFKPLVEDPLLPSSHAESGEYIFQTNDNLLGQPVEYPEVNHKEDIKKLKRSTRKHRHHRRARLDSEQEQINTTPGNSVRDFMVSSELPNMSPQTVSQDKEEKSLLKRFGSWFWSSEEDENDREEPNNSTNLTKLSQETTKRPLSNETIHKEKNTLGQHKDREPTASLAKGTSTSSTKNNTRAHLKSNVNEKRKRCPNCPEAGNKEEDVKLLRLEMFQDLMMKKLRMTPDDLTVGDKDKRAKAMLPILPDSILQQTLRDNAYRDPPEEFYAKDKQVVIPGKFNKDCISYEATGCYDFRLSGNIHGQMESAQLWIYKTEDRNDVNPQTLLVYELERNNRNVLKRRNIIMREDTFQKDDWVTMGLSQAVRRWVDRRLPKVMLAIRCKTCNTRNPKALYGHKHGYAPLLMITYKNHDRVYRERRSSSDSCDPRSECCKRPLMAHFREINMASIIQPSSLNVGYCFGYCNSISQYTFNHTTIKQTIRWSSSSDESTRAQLEPCCVPLQLKDAFILTHDYEGAVVQKLLRGIIVERCGCM